MRCSHTECHYNSYSHSGSIYLGLSAESLNPTNLRLNGIHAVILLGNTVPVNLPSNVATTTLLSQPQQRIQLEPAFNHASAFIAKHRRTTNILIQCNSEKSMGLLLIMAYLIKEYHYSLRYVLELYEATLKDLPLPKADLQQLNYFFFVNQKKPDRDEEEIADLPLYRRILYVRRAYPKFTVTSRGMSQSKQLNPQKGPLSHRKSNTYDLEALESEFDAFSMSKGESTDMPLQSARKIAKPF